MMKRMLAVLLALALLLGCAAAETAAETESAAHQIEQKTYPFYLDKSNKLWREDFPLYFLDGAGDLPYVDVRDWTEALNYIYPEMAEDGYTDFSLTSEVMEAENKVIVTRNKTYRMTLDFSAGRITWDDFTAFFQRSEDLYIDPVGVRLTDKEGRPFLLSRTNSRHRYGAVTMLNLKDYAIEMVAQDGKYLVPMQTFSDYCFTQIGRNAYFNGQGIFVARADAMVPSGMALIQGLIMNGLMSQDELMDYMQNSEGSMDEKMSRLMAFLMSTEKGSKFLRQFQQDQMTSLYELYANAPQVERSEALAGYGYRELCMMLDSFYGLKEVHNITEFNVFFQQTGLVSDLLGPDADTADSAIADLTSYWLDDGHSGFVGPSYLSAVNPSADSGFSSAGREALSGYVRSVRQKYSEASEHYYEVDDTAYVTFDSFLFEQEDDQIVDYYALAEKGELPDDVFGIIIKAHRQITRENSPVKNVVLDLSCNGGGAGIAAAYTLGWFLGDAEFSVRDTFTGSESTIVYRADVNLDREFDEKDTLVGKGLNLYCLISPLSFSCGNLIPWAFKADSRVTLLGKVTGGGSCVVFPRASAWGTSFQVSGPMRVSFVKNGSYYDVDEGVDPDHFIDTYEHFYDRKTLTDYIHSLY